MVINFYGLSKFFKRDCVVICIETVLILKYVLVVKTFKGFEILECFNFPKYNCCICDNVFKDKDISIRYALELNKRHTDMEFLKGGE